MRNAALIAVAAGLMTLFLLGLMFGVLPDGSGARAAVWVALTAPFVIMLGADRKGCGGCRLSRIRKATTKTDPADPTNPYARTE